MDWNGDGKKDLLTGEYNGNIRIYLNTNTDADPVFSGYTKLMVGGVAFDGGSYTAIDLADWNNDDLIDVICGDSSGQIWLLINTGSPGNPYFATSARVQDGAGNLDPGGTTCPCVVDWNRDGKKDLLVGETYGNIYYYENYGTDSAPIFNGWVKLLTGFSAIDVGYYSRPSVTDWDEDGVLDILCGDDTGQVWFFHAQGPLILYNNVISDSAGGSIIFRLNAGPANADRTYLLLASSSGTEPGYVLPGGMVLPLNPDAFSFMVINWINSPVFTDFLGTLNQSGVGNASMNVPPNTGYAGEMLHFAYTLYDPYDYVSNAAAVEYVP